MSTKDIIEIVIGIVGIIASVMGSTQLKKRINKNRINIKNVGNVNAKNDSKVKMSNVKIGNISNDSK